MIDHPVLAQDNSRHLPGNIRQKEAVCATIRMEMKLIGLCKQSTSVSGYERYPDIPTTRGISPFGLSP